MECMKKRTLQNSNVITFANALYYTMKGITGDIIGPVMLIVIAVLIKLIQIIA